MPMTETAPQNTSDHATRLPSGRWAPGRSPNPGGRPKIIAEALRPAAFWNVRECDKAKAWHGRTTKPLRWLRMLLRGRVSAVLVKVPAVRSVERMVFPERGRPAALSPRQIRGNDGANPRAHR